MAVTANQAPAPPSAASGRGVTARSDGNGAYVLKVPSAGEYRVAFEYEGFERQVHTITVTSDDATLDVRLELAAIPQTIKVTQSADDNPERESKPGEVVFPADALERTPIGRGPERAADMAPA